MNGRTGNMVVTNFQNPVTTNERGAMDYGSVESESNMADDQHTNKPYTPPATFIHISQNNILSKE